MNSLLGRLQSALLRASSRERLFYTTLAAQRCANLLCEYYTPWTDVYYSCFTAWTRLVCGYGKPGPRTCMRRPFQNAEIVRCFITELCNPDPSGVARRWVTKSRDSSKSTGIGEKLGGGPLIPVPRWASNFYAIDFWRDKTRGSARGGPPAVRSCVDVTAV